MFSFLIGFALYFAVALLSLEVCRAAYVSAIVASGETADDLDGAIIRAYSTVNSQTFRPDAVAYVALTAVNMSGALATENGDKLTEWRSAMRGALLTHKRRR